ncbi:hypothetical protein GWK47_030500 [Chionoecetes opilio]|uniref:Uncharacterized protein n=1 Tax=Chionoecetes opilio TaxID=41210 RepID=A0A8J4Z1G9_CHIOP|nr:hypothetical protein GWK47_030500 [Chionoecetes opilio]
MRFVRFLGVPHRPSIAFSNVPKPHGRARPRGLGREYGEEVAISEDVKERLSMDFQVLQEREDLRDDSGKFWSNCHLFPRWSPSRWNSIPCPGSNAQPGGFQNPPLFKIGFSGAVRLRRRRSLAPAVVFFVVRSTKGLVWGFFGSSPSTRPRIIKAPA